MPEAITMPTTQASRRAALRWGGAAAIVGAIGLSAKAAPIRPDAELLALCERFGELQQQIVGLFDDEGSMDDDEREEIIAGISDEQAPIFERMMTIKATTHAGLVARARTLALWAPDSIENHEPGCMWNERMLAALLRDLTAMNGSV